MPWLPSNVDELDIEVSRGHDTTVTLDFVDTAPGDVSLWYGGSLDDLDDLTGATEVEGTVASFVATFAIPAQSTERQAVRLERDGEVVTAGYLMTTTRGRRRATASYTVNIGDVEATASIVGGSPSVADDVANLPVATSNYSTYVDTATAGQVRWWDRPLILVAAAGYTTSTKTSMLSATPEIAANTLAANDLLSGELAVALTNTSGSNRVWTFGVSLDGTDLFTIATPNVATGASNALALIRFRVLFAAGFSVGWATVAVDGLATEGTVILIATPTLTNALTVDAHSTVSGATISTTPSAMFVEFSRGWTG